MQDSMITCPKCGHNINLTEIEKHKLNEERKNLEEVLREQMAKKEIELTKELAQKEEQIKKEMWAKAQVAAEKKFTDENQAKLVELEALRKRDDESRKKELEFLRERERFATEQKNMVFEKEKAIFDVRKKIEEEMKLELARTQTLETEKQRLEWEKKLAERDKQMEILQRSLSEANQKANQRSMQIQGEIQENALKELLIREFPYDTVDDVPTGVKGADLVQGVRSERGVDVGVIAWESKNTKAWSDIWVDKLKEDRLRVNASVSVIISNVLPDSIQHFGLYKGIWVTEWAYVIPLTIALREQMSAMEHVRNSLAGKDEKMEMLYSYLTSTEFRDKIQNIIEAFQAMKDSLESERRSMERIWSSREKQLERVITNTARLYGDMQGLIGSKMEKVPYLELESGEN